jgi:cell shape-determining protein MreD
MRYIVYLILGLLLMGLHTAILSDFPEILSFYDILIPFVVYLSLFRSLSAGILVVVIIGYFMDMVSGSPDGIYMAAFMIIFLMFRNITAYFHAQETLLFTICTAVGVFVENLIFCLLLLLGQADLQILINALQLLIVQLIWVFLTAPLIYRVFAALFVRVDHIRATQ